MAKADKVVSLAMDPAVDSPIATGYRPPRDPVEIWLARLWQEVLGLEVGIRDNFFEVGGNSLDAARVIDSILGDFDLQLPLNVLTENPTVETLATRIRTGNDGNKTAVPSGLSGMAGMARMKLSAPLLRIQGGDGTYPPLFMVHSDSGQVGPYCRLAHALGEEFTLFGLQADGLYSEAEPIGTVAGMARAYLQAIRAAHPNGPYLLGGCSIGSAIAFEMACELVSAGAEVKLLAAVDAELIEPIGGLAESWFRWPDRAEPDRILQDWKAYELVPPDETPNFVARSLRVWQANQDAIRSWQPRPYSGPLDIFRHSGARPLAVRWPQTIVQRVHECTTAENGTGVEQLAGGLRELINY